MADAMTIHQGAFWPMAALAALGAFHGVNPGMGWLFAVALGMQERSRAAVWRAMVPLAAGHGLAVGVAILAAVALGLAASPETLRMPIGIFLIVLGVYRFFRHCHPRFGGMRVGPKGLAMWSFLMATAHGAGLMVVPIFLGMAPTAIGGASCHASHVAGGMEPWTGLVATLVHGAGYLSATALIAWLVYEKLGVGLLRKAWLNLDLIWAVALVATGVLSFAI